MADRHLSRQLYGIVIDMHIQHILIYKCYNFYFITHKTTRKDSWGNGVTSGVAAGALSWVSMQRQTLGSIKLMHADKLARESSLITKVFRPCNSRILYDKSSFILSGMNSGSAPFNIFDF